MTEGTSNSRKYREGIILLDKPPGRTSFQSLGFLKRRLGAGKIGHAGTLDKFADGLLIVLVGRMTRLSSIAASFDKEYIAAFIFGHGTDTLDPEGAVTGEGPVPTRDEIEDVLTGFRGLISQVPPVYSAVHVQTLRGGLRASEATRKGETFRLLPREVTIDRLDILDFNPPEVRFRISCSKGTYIRSLARDIAGTLGTCAYVSRLRRIRIGGFSVEDACTPDKFEAGRDILPPSAFFKASPALRLLSVKEEWALPVSRGIRLSEATFEETPSENGTYGAFSPDERLLAVIEKEGSTLRYVATFPAPAGAEGSP